MYWIDINLLNDRPEYASDTIPSTIQVTDSKTPLFVGLGIGAAALAVTFAGYGLMGLFNQNLTAKEQDFQAKIDRLAPQLKEVESLQQQKAQIDAETSALAKIFSQIKPWSAMLADLRDRIPATLQINSIAQASAAPAAPPAEGAAPEKPPAAAPVSGASSNLVVTGSALSFGDVNDFVLTLRQSNYLNSGATDTKLNDATLSEEKGGDLVQYKIDTQINNAPAESLLTALRQNGASGLVSRIETLKRQGVIKP